MASNDKQELKDGDLSITVQARDIDTAAMVAPDGPAEELPLDVATAAMCDVLIISI